MAIVSLVPIGSTLDSFATPASVECNRKDRGPGKLRIDTHVRSGERISPHYDSLVAKVIGWGATREAAIETLVRALASAHIEGIATTAPLALAVLRSKEFASGRYDTGSIPGWPPR